MAKPRKVTRQKTIYITNCSVCGKELEVSKDSTKDICYDCQCNQACEKAIADGQWMIGAEIVSIEPRYHGHLTDIYELE